MSGPSDCPITRAIDRVLNFFATSFGSSSYLAPVQVEGNLVDCALARPIIDSEVSDEILEVGEIAGEQEAAVGLKVLKSGRTTAVTHGTISLLDVTSSVNMGDGDIALFSDQMAIVSLSSDPFSQPGDSGSVILTDDKKIVGLLFAGSDLVTIANRWANVAQELRLDPIVESAKEEKNQWKDMSPMAKVMGFHVLQNTAMLDLLEEKGVVSREEIKARVAKNEGISVEELERLLKEASDKA